MQHKLNVMIFNDYSELFRAASRIANESKQMELDIY